MDDPSLIDEFDKAFAVGTKVEVDATNVKINKQWHEPNPECDGHGDHPKRLYFKVEDRTEENIIRRVADYLVRIDTEACVTSIGCLPEWQQGDWLRQARHIYYIVTETGRFSPEALARIRAWSATND